MTDAKLFFNSFSICLINELFLIKPCTHIFIYYHPYHVEASYYHVRISEYIMSEKCFFHAIVYIMMYVSFIADINDFLRVRGKKYI